MSATMIMTTPPPTNNSLDKEERARLLRSTRKLGAVLGTTPLLVEVEAQPARSQKDKIRREGRLFSHSTASSISSMASFATASSATVVSHTRPSIESDYVFVRRNGRTAPYQVQAVFDNASPASSRSASPMPGVGTSVTQTSQSHASSTPAVTRKRKQSRNEKWIDANGGATPGQEPRDVLVSATSGSAFTSSASGSGSKQTRSSAKGKDTGSATSSHLPHPTQPLLLRPRAGPVSEPTDSDINFTSAMDDSDSISISTVSQPQPLSPTSSTFNMSLLTVDPFLPSSSSKALSDREKRRKLAKLARTLGENIPPELVFRSNSSNSSPPRRRASLSIKPYSNSGLSTITSKAPTLPPLAVAEMPLPTLSSESVPQPRPKQASNLLARARPRSLALGSTSAFVAANNALSSKTHRNVVEAARGTTSLDVQRQSPAPRGVQLLPLGVSTKPCYPPSPRPFVNAVAPQSRSSSSSSSSDTSDDDESDNDAKNGVSLEWGRRKEREWSGEWNLRDMEDVAMKLRCLKGR